MSYWCILAAALLAGLSSCARSAAPADVADPRPATVGTPDALVMQGQNAERRGDSVRAEQYWSLALHAGADPRRVLPGLLRVCVAGSRLRAALNHAEPHLRNHPGDATLRYLVATLHVSLNQERTARLHLERLLQEPAAFPDAHYLLGTLDQSSGDLESALSHYRRYLELARYGEHAREVRSRIVEMQIEAGARTSPDANALFDERGPRMDAPTEGRTLTPTEQRP